MSTPAGDDLVGDATIRVDGDTDPALRALNQFSRDANGRLRDLRGRFVTESALINRSLTNAAGGGDRFGGALRALAGAARGAAGVLGRAGASIGALGAAAGSAAPLLAGIVTTLQNVAPAGAVAVTGMLAVQQASAVVQLGMVGIEDAATAAFDTSAAGAQKFDEAIKKLAPNARAFAVALREAQPAFQRLQQGVQNRLFAGFADELGRLSQQVLPIVRTNLNATATTLNQMALGASAAARNLATNGTLGKAMAGATQGLTNLRTLPGQVVTALGQLAAAGAPAFDRITAAASSAASGISERLSAAFESGALEQAVNTAVGVLRDLGTVAGNVFGTLGNIMGPVQEAGGGVVNVLVEITGAFREATATQGFQQAIGALAQVMGTLARTVGPLIGQALAALGPVFTALGPPVERLITNLGSALSPILTALGPVLGAAATAVGQLLDAISPILPVIGNLIASLLPPLVPVLQAVGQAFTQLAPIVAQVGQILTAVLAPIIASLPQILAPLLASFTQMTSTVLPTVQRLLVALTPAFASLGQSFAQVLVAAAPLLAVLAQMGTQLLTRLLPVITPLIPLVGRLASVFAGQLAMVLQNVVVPALNTISALLRGDFSGALENAKRLVTGFVSTAVGQFTALPGRVFSALGTLAGRLRSRATEAGAALLAATRTKLSEAVTAVRGLPGRAGSALGSLAGQLRGRAVAAGSQMVSALRGKVNEAVGAVRAMPGRAASALGNLSGRLVSAGRDLMRGMINGIRSMAGSLVSAAKDVVGSAVSAAKSALGISSPSKVFATIGKQTGQGFIKGLTGTQSQIKATSQKVIGSITSAFRGSGSRTDDRLVAMIGRNNKRLQSLAGQRDAIAKKIADANKFATDLASKAASTGSLGSIVSADFAAPNQVKAQMQQSLSQIKAFTANVQKIAKKGLNKNLLRQILELGPEQGAAFAQALAGADKATIRQYNSINKQLGAASSKLGSTGADLLYDSGKKAGAGFLTGLKAQQKSIEKLMLSIAKGMQRAIRRALGIKSPSRVMAAIGQMTVQGLGGGITAMVPTVDRAMARVAGAVTAGVPARVPAFAGAGALGPLGVSGMRTTGTPAPATNIINLNLRNDGVIGSQIELDNWLTRSLDRLDKQGRLPKRAS